MKALTLTQPFATLIAIGAKRIETRDWSTTYRGPLAIHAAKGFARDDYDYAVSHAGIRGALVLGGVDRLTDLPRGCVVAVAVLVACEPTEVAGRGRLVTPNEELFGDFSPGRYAWHLRDVLALPKPLAARGTLGLWDFHDPQLNLWLAGQGWPAKGATTE